MDINPKDIKCIERYRPSPGPRLHLVQINQWDISILVNKNSSASPYRKTLNSISDP